MRRKGVDQAWDALEEMQRTGLRTDRFTISRMLMKTLADSRRWLDTAKIQRCVALVESFIEQQPDEADEVLFNALLDSHCRVKDTAALEATFQKMKDLHIEPSHVTLGILVKAYGQANDIHSALRIWEEMSEQRRQANAVTYGCMINACVHCNLTDQALDIFRKMQQLGKHCNTILYTILIKGFGKSKDLDGALALFREMRAEGIAYNTIAYNCILDVCIKCGNTGVAEEIFTEMIKPGSKVEPDLITFSTLLKGYCQAGQLDKALQTAEAIKVSGMQCDELVYNTLIDGCVKANDLTAGIGLFAEMMRYGMRPSVITHSIFVRLYERNGYKGSASDAVAQLYEHHGLHQPGRAHERGSKIRAGSNYGHRRKNGYTMPVVPHSPPQWAPLEHFGSGGCFEASDSNGDCYASGVEAFDMRGSDCYYGGDEGDVESFYGCRGDGNTGAHGVEQQQYLGEALPWQGPPGRWLQPRSRLVHEAQFFGPNEHVANLDGFPYMPSTVEGQLVPEPNYGLLSSPSTYGGVSIECQAGPHSGDALQFSPMLDASQRSPHNSFAFGYQQNSR